MIERFYKNTFVNRLHSKHTSPHKRLTKIKPFYFLPSNYFALIMLLTFTYYVQSSLLILFSILVFSSFSLSA